jgi:hypothetical protein
MSKVTSFLMVVAVLFFCLTLPSCSSGDGLTVPDTGDYEGSTLGELIKRQILWTVDDEVADSDLDEKRVDVTNCVIHYSNVTHRNSIHRYTGNPSFADDAQVVFAWQQKVGDYLRVKWRVAYDDHEMYDPNWSDVYTISDGATNNNSWPAVTSYIETNGKMTVDILYQKKQSNNVVCIRHDRWQQQTKDNYNSFSHVSGYPKTVSQTQDWHCRHPDVVYHGQNEYHDPPDPDNYGCLFAVYERYTAPAGGSGDREIWYAEFNESSGSWGDRTRIDTAGDDSLPLYPRIDTGWDDTTWGDNGYVTAVVWHQYEYSGATITDIDIWGNIFAPRNPGNYAFEITWEHAEGDDFEPDDRWSVFPYVDIDPQENDERAIHIVWTHFKDNDPDDDPTIMYWNTEMYDASEEPRVIYDHETRAEGLVTLAVCWGNDPNQTACAVWIYDTLSPGDYPVWARSINFTNVNSIAVGTKIRVSGGVSYVTDDGICGPVPAVRHARTVHVGWTDWDSGDTDYGIYADYSTF